MDQLLNSPLREEGLPVLLASFCDRLLSKNATQQDQDLLLVQLKKVCLLFNHLKDKDVFK